MKYKINFSGFDWDSGNSEKCKKHGVSTKEIEDLFYSQGCFQGEDDKHSMSEDRYFLVGQSSLRDKYVYLIYILRKHDNNILVRPISARYMHRKEIKLYEKTFTKIKI